jgi:hypothetical protein
VIISLDSVPQNGVFVGVVAGGLSIMSEEPNQVFVPPAPELDEYNLKGKLETAQDELVKLIQERQTLEWRINRLQNDIVHLAALCNVEVEDPLAQLGLTDAVRWILASEKKPLAVNEIVEALRRSYPDVSEYKNLPANVHTVIRRLVKASAVRPVDMPADAEPARLEGLGGFSMLPDAEPAKLKGLGGPRRPVGTKYVWAGGIPRRALSSLWSRKK